MSLEQQRKDALDRAEEIATLAQHEQRDFTDDEIGEVDQLKSQVDELDEKIAKSAKAKSLVKSLTEVDPHAGTGGGAEAGSLGQAFTKSEAYQAFQKDHPSGVGSGTPVSIGRVKVASLDNGIGRKAVTSDQAQLQPTRMPMITPDNPPLTLLDVITRGTTAGAFEYLQVQSVTRNAAIVPEATSGTDDNALKPVSDITTGLEDAKVYTYADGLEVTNQMLSDAPALATYLNSELGYSVNNLVEEKLLNGTGTNGEPKGILNTTGVQQQTFDTDVPRTLRNALLKVTQNGGQVTGVVLSPEDDAEMDLMTDGNNRYYGQGPFGLGPNTIWGRPRIVSHRLPQGTAILGDLRTITLLDREGLSVLAFNQHKDFAQRNMTYIRAELRAAQAIFKPANLVVATLAGTTV